MEYTGLHTGLNTPVRLSIQDGSIQAVETIEAEEDLPFIGPPLLDMQVNGYCGININNEQTASPEDLQKITETFTELGITFWVPTIITNAQENIINLLENIREAVDMYPDVHKAVPGIHVEGPYISPEDGPRGAHDSRYVREPSIDEYREWQEAAGGMVKIVTLAPEYENASEFIREIVKDGTVASLGHCGSDRDRILEAVDAGATLATHLGNGAHPMVPRHNCYIWELLAEDRIWAGLIGDGFHLPQAQLKNFIRAKRPERVVLTSDVVDLGGMDPGMYEFGAHTVKMREDGKIVLAENEDIMAGASFHLLFSIEHAVNLAGCSIVQAWNMASINPAEMMGISSYPRVEKGDPALFAVFRWIDGKLSIEHVIDERQY